MIERYRDTRPRWMSWLRVLGHIRRVPRPSELGESARRRLVFERIHQRNAWKDADSRSGSSSNPRVTAALREELPRLFAELAVESIVDVPCGDFAWMRAVDLGTVRYLGADIVPALVEANRAGHATASRNFQVLDLARDPLPNADLVLCRDGLTHLSHSDVRAALRNIRASGATWLLTTTYRGAHRDNPDIVTGDWRAIALEKPPFHFPAPRRTIGEALEERGYGDKVLALWPTSAIP